MSFWNLKRDVILEAVYEESLCWKPETDILGFSLDDPAANTADNRPNLHTPVHTMEVRVTKVS